MQANQCVFAGLFTYHYILNKMRWHTNGFFPKLSDNDHKKFRDMFVKEVTLNFLLDPLKGNNFEEILRYIRSIVCSQL